MLVPGNHGGVPTMKERSAVVAFGFILAYAAIYAGDDARSFISTAREWVATLAIEGVVFAGVLALVFGGFYARSRMEGADPDEVGAAIHAVMFLVPVAFVYDALAMPFTRDGAAPWNWTSGWVFILVVAVIPCAEVIFYVIVEALEQRAERKRQAAQTPGSKTVRAA